MAKGAGLKILWLRPAWVRTPPPALGWKHRTKEDIINFILWLRKRGYRDSTIRGFVKCLKGLRTDLRDPELVWKIIAYKEVTSGTKEKLVNFYVRFCEFASIELSYIPRYTRIEKLPYIPFEKDIDSLHASCFSVVLEMDRIRVSASRRRLYVRCGVQLFGVIGRII